jgi:hypothetical protein
MEKLYNEIIPEFVAEFEAVDVRMYEDLTYTDYSEHLFLKVRLAPRLRYYGINLRHMGR